MRVDDAVSIRSPLCHRGEQGKPGHSLGSVTSFNPLSDTWPERTTTGVSPLRFGTCFNPLPGNIPRRTIRRRGVKLTLGVSIRSPTRSRREPTSMELGALGYWFQSAPRLARENLSADGQGVNVVKFQSALRRGCQREIGTTSNSSNVTPKFQSAPEHGARESLGASARHVSIRSRATRPGELFRQYSSFPTEQFQSAPRRMAGENVSLARSRTTRPMFQSALRRMPERTRRSGQEGTVLEFQSAPRRMAGENT